MDPQNALFQVSKRGDDEDMAELLNGSYKVDVNKPDDTGNFALHYAAAADHTKCVSIMLSKGANPNVTNKLRETPLHKAAARGALRTAKLLVNNGANVNAIDKEGKAPRQVAVALGGKPELIDVLTPGVKIDFDVPEPDADEDDSA